MPRRRPLKEVRLGNEHFKRQEFDLAVNAYNKAIELNPQALEGCLKAFFWRRTAPSG